MSHFRKSRLIPAASALTSISDCGRRKARVQKSVQGRHHSLTSLTVASAVVGSSLAIAVLNFLSTPPSATPQTPASQYLQRARRPPQPLGRSCYGRRKLT